MSLFGDIGNIFHSIGHFFNGGDNNNQPHNQPVVVNPILTGRAAAPNFANTNNNTSNKQTNTANNNQQPSQQNDPLLRLYQGPNHNGTFDPNAPLVKAHPNPNDPNLPINQQVARISAEANQAPANTADRAVNTVADSVARTATGIPQGISQLFDLLTPGKGTNRVTKALNGGAQEIDQDQAKNGLQGRVGNDLYHGLQVAENVVPGAIGLVKAAPAAIKAAPELIKAAPDMLASLPSKAAAVASRAGHAIDDAFTIPDEAFALNKANTATDTRVAAGIQRPDEVSTGITSVNPNQAADALKVIQDKEAQAIANQATTFGDQSSLPASTGPQPHSTTPQTPPETPATSGPGQVAPQLSETPALPPTGSPHTPQPPIENLSPEPPNVNTPNNVAQKPNDVNAPEPGNTVSAPNVIAQLKKDLDAAGAKAPKIDDPSHDVLSNEDLNQAANRFVQAQSDEDLLKSYSTGANVKDAQSLATAVAATKRLGELSKAGVEGADQAIENILDGAAQGTSGAGRLMNYVQNMYDTLPQPAKVKYLVRSIDKSREAAGLAPLSDAESAAAESTIDHFLTETEAAQNAASAAEGEIQAIKDKIGTGQLTKEDLDKIAQYDKAAKDASLVAQKTQGDLARAYDQYAPQVKNATNVGKNIGNMGRSLMLTSISGRVSDVATTSMNVLHTLTQNSIEGVIGKIANAARDAAGKTPGKYIDTLPSPGAMLHGTDEGLKKASGNFRGHTYVTDVQKAIKTGSEGGKTQLQRAAGTGPLNWVRNTAHAMAETATNLSNGVKNTKILQLAYQEGKAKGLEGVDLDVYAHSTAALPSRQMAARGEKLVEEVNNMNDNPFTHGLESMAKGLDKIPIFGEQVRNIIAPFNRWVGGQMWNGITDKNVVANVLKMGKAMIDGDSQEAIHQLAGAATNTVGTMSAGYGLAKSGVLTTKNGQGYNDDGLYLHLGGHFIPVSFFGFAAPGIIMGWATHEALKDNSGKPIWQKVLNSAGEVLSKSAETVGRAYLGNTVLGGSSEVINQTQEAIQGKSGVTGGDAAATAGTSAAGDYVPGIFGDVNSAINTFNIGGLNPTHEAALTKVTKGDQGVITKDGNISKAKDIPATDMHQFINKIPVLGQKVLPRNPGVPANDFGSRITRGDNQSATEVQQQYDAAHPSGPALTKANDQADRAKFVQSNKETGTINGKTYINYNGKVSSYDTPLKAQQALDEAKFKDRQGGSFQQKNGMVYERGSNGKVTAMEQKDYDYKQASDTIKSAKDSGDLNGTLEGQSKLLDNVQWQLNHADLTPQNRASLVDTAAKTQADFNKYQLWGDFTKPKGAPSYDPTFTGGNEKTSNYIKTIKEAGAKYGVDINALLSVAAQEGLGGGVGDNGTSFGPFQLHEGGALPSGKDQAWAESPEGIDYAVKTIASVAKGKIGPDAIKAIVTQFERSADQPTEIANALSVYEGGTANLKSTSGTGSSVTASGSSSASDLVKSNTIGNLPQMARESFIENGLTAKPITPNIPQIKLTQPQTLIKAHKITVGMPKA